MKKLLYIGNNLIKSTNYLSAMETLSSMLEKEGYEIIKSSNKNFKVFRLFDMCLSTFINRRNTSYILIDTFSTLNFYYALIISQLSRVLNVKYIPILHGGNLPLRLTNSPYFSKLIFSNAYLNVTPSKYLEEAFSKNNLNTHFIPNGIDISQLIFQHKEPIEPKLLWVRAFDKTYNPEMAIKVVSKLKTNYPKILLCMVGPDKDGSLNRVKELTKKFKLEENIIFTGVLPRKDWVNLANGYSIFINTSNIDNLPVSILEAMALGFPIVSTNVGGLPYLISNNKNGILVAKNCADEMANAISALIENQKAAIELGKNAREYVLQYDINVIKKKWLAILK